MAIPPRFTPRLYPCPIMSDPPRIEDSGGHARCDSSESFRESSAWTAMEYPTDGARLRIEGVASPWQKDGEVTITRSFLVSITRRARGRPPFSVRLPLRRTLTRGARLPLAGELRNSLHVLERGLRQRGTLPLTTLSLPIQTVAGWVSEETRRRHRAWLSSMPRGEDRQSVLRGVCSISRSIGKVGREAVRGAGNQTWNVSLAAAGRTSLPTYFHLITFPGRLSPGIAGFSATFSAKGSSWTWIIAARTLCNSRLAE